MPKGWTTGPQGQLRPLAPGACARVVMEIATGQREEHVEKPDLPPEDPNSPPPPLFGPGFDWPERPVSARRARHNR